MSGADSGSDSEASSHVADSDSSNRNADSDSDGSDLALGGSAPGSESSTLIIGGRLVHLFFEIERDVDGSLNLNIYAYPDPVRSGQASHLSLRITLGPLIVAVVFRSD